MIANLLPQKRPITAMGNAKQKRPGRLFPSWEESSLHAVAHRRPHEVREHHLVQTDAQPTRTADRDSHVERRYESIFFLYADETASAPYNSHIRPTESGR